MLAMIIFLAGMDVVRLVYLVVTLIQQHREEMEYLRIRSEWITERRAPRSATPRSEPWQH